MPHLTLLDRTTSQSFRVEAADAVVGRDPNAAIVLEGDAAAVVSGRHARFVLSDGNWYVEDLGSRNGTFIRGQRLQPGAPWRLSRGDEVGFGATGPKLFVQEVMGRNFASTLAEPTPATPMQTVIEPKPAPLRVAAPAAVPSLAPSAPTSGRQSVRVALRSSDGKRLNAQDFDVVVGRSRDCTIKLDGDMSLAVSRRHLRIFFSGWKICIEDLGSRNGTWLNRKRVDGPTIIERGDVIEFGAGGPKLTVEDVALIASEARRTEVELPAVRQDSDSTFVSELPTPGPLPARRVSGGHRKQ